MEEKDKKIIKEDVQSCFIERNENSIKEKISYCMDAGMTEDEAHHTISQIVKNLSADLILFLSCNYIKSTQDAKEWS